MTQFRRRRDGRRRVVAWHFKDQDTKILRTLFQVVSIGFLEREKTRLRLVHRLSWRSLPRNPCLQKREEVPRLESLSSLIELYRHRWSQNIWWHLGMKSKINHHQLHEASVFPLTLLFHLLDLSDQSPVQEKCPHGFRKRSNRIPLLKSWTSRTE